jgi:hypothetical protein
MEIEDSIFEESVTDVQAISNPRLLSAKEIAKLNPFR